MAKSSIKDRKVQDFNSFGVVFGWIMVLWLIITLGTTVLAGFASTNYHSNAGKPKQVMAANQFWRELNIEAATPRDNSASSRLVRYLKDNGLDENKLAKVYVADGTFNGVHDQLGIQAFECSEPGYCYDYGKFDGGFLAEMALARQGQLSTLLRQVPPSPNRNWLLHVMSWRHFWPWYLGWSTLAFVLACLLADSVDNDSDIDSWQVPVNWVSYEGDVAARWAVAILAPQMFGLFVVYKLLALAGHSWQGRREQERLLALPTADDITWARNEIHRLKLIAGWAQIPAVKAEVAELEAFIMRNAETSPIAVWQAKEAVANISAEREQRQQRIDLKSQTLRELSK